jgi:PKD repeat protein
MYYDSTSTKRVNDVNGWGTLITPFGTFNNCLKVESNLVQIDTMSIDTVGFPVDTTYIREFRWLSPGWNYPLLIVRQTLAGSVYVTQSIEYYDNQQYFQPFALFAYLPVAPIVGDTVVFQNLSSNSSAFRWNFDDPSSGPNDSSAVTNPSHIFNSPDTFFVRLIAQNGTLSDTMVLPVIVSLMTAVTAPQVYETMNMYPNPATEKIYIEGIQPGPGEILIYDCTGKIAGRFPLANELNIAALAPGVYTVFVREEDKTTQRKLIKL